MDNIWENLLDRASEVTGAVLTARNQPKPNAIAKPAPAPAMNWKPWAIGGAIVLGVVALGAVLLRKK